MDKDIEEIVDEDMELGIYDEVDFVTVYEIDNIGRKVTVEPINWPSSQETDRRLSKIKH